MKLASFCMFGILLAFLDLSSGYATKWDSTKWHVLPYKARILREGQPCTEEGFFRDSVDCQKFYRCALLPDAIGNKLTRYEFRCPDGTVFDEGIATCNYASQMENPPQNCKADTTTAAPVQPSWPPVQQPSIPPVQQPQFPGAPGGGSEGSQQQPGSNPQFPSAPSNPQQQIPSIPSNQQPPAQEGGSNQPGAPSNQQPPAQFPGGFPSNQQPPSQFPNQPAVPGGGNQQVPGFPQTTSAPPRQTFFLPSTFGQQTRPTFFQNQEYNQQHMQHYQQPMITFGRF